MYDYDYESNEFDVRLGSGGNMLINFEYEVVYIGDAEFEFKDDTLSDIYVRYKSEFIPVYALIEHFAGKLDAIRAECEQEMEDERRMAEELSSPEKTGRV